MTGKSLSLIIILLLNLPMAFACGSRDTNTLKKSVIGAEATKSETSGNVEPDDYLSFMKHLTGHENIIDVFGDIEKLKELQKIIDNGARDTSGRFYFTFSSRLRPAPVSFLHQRRDVESGLAIARQKLNSEYVIDITFNVRSSDGKEMRSFKIPDAIKFTRDFMLIASRLETVISYTVDHGNNNYSYGEYLVISAIVSENRESDFYHAIKSLEDNDFNALLERTIYKKNEG